MSATIPAAWQAAADAASTAGAHRQRLLVRIVINDAGDAIWLSQPAVAEDAAGLGVWSAAGAWSSATEFGPYPLLDTVPDLGTLSDLEGMESLSAGLSGLRLSNEKRADMLADIGAERLSDIRLVGSNSFRSREARVVASYAGVAWADRLEWSLLVREIDSFDEVEIRLNCSERVGVGSNTINTKITVADHPYRPPENANSPKPIVFGAGSVALLPIREHVILTDREGQAVSGGNVSPLNPSVGAPWTAGDAVTYGSGTATTASVTGTDDTDTQLNLDAPGLARDTDHGEGDLSTYEEGYHVTDVPASAVMDYVAADPDFTHAIGTIKHLPPGGRDVLPLPSYCGTPVDNADGTITLDKMPRSGGRISQAWLDGTAGAGVTAATIFGELASAKIGETGTVEAGAGTLSLQGARAGWVTSLEVLKVLDIQSRSRIFWNGSELKMRKRQTAAEIGASFDWDIDRDDAIEGFPAIEELPVQYQLDGFTARWALKPGRSRGDAQSYAGQKELGNGGNPKGELFWFDFVRADATGEELGDFWYELLGPMTSGRWPRYMGGLVLDWSFIGVEPEDIFRVVRIDGEGDATDGLSVGNAARWRVVDKVVRWPDSKRAGQVVVDLLEVNS